MPYDPGWVSHLIQQQANQIKPRNTYRLRQDIQYGTKSTLYGGVLVTHKVCCRRFLEVFSIMNGYPIMSHSYYGLKGCMYGEVKEEKNF